MSKIDGIELSEDEEQLAVSLGLEEFLEEDTPIDFAFDK